ncbi:RDD family protein [Niallia sp. 03133]|uniref:RDD family protein n=1 Tax=Niallia sp. 03133 TaxID=3458060 RepID=UPI004044E402
MNNGSDPKEITYQPKQMENIEAATTDEEKEASSLNKEDEAPVSQEVKFHYAGFWMRFWAYLADLLIIGSLNRILIYPVCRWLDLPLHEGGLFTAVNISTAILFYLYFVLMTKYLKQTLGKMIFGLKVIPLKKAHLTWDTVLFREWIGRFISASIMILYILVAFMPKKQGLHDLFADTAVVHAR